MDGRPHPLWLRRLPDYLPDDIKANILHNVGYKRYSSAKRVQRYWRGTNARFEAFYRTWDPWDFIQTRMGYGRLNRDEAMGIERNLRGFRLKLHYFYLRMRQYMEYVYSGFDSDTTQVNF